MGLFSTTCPNCERQIRKLAKFCSYCGKPSPRGWTHCPTCKAEVGTDSAFCWKCGGVLLKDEGDTTLSLGYVGVRTREDVAVNVSIDVVVRLADLEAVATNLLRGRPELTDDDLADLLRAETLNVVEARLGQVSVTDLHGNTDLKTALESDLKDGMATTLERNGLELVQLRFLDFYGDAYEKVRTARGETFVAEELAAENERRTALNKRIRERLTREQMDTFATAKDLQDFIRQTEHELGLKDVVRDAEMVDLRRTYEAKRDDAEIARKHLLEKLELEQALGVRRMQRTGEAEEVDHEIEQQRKGLAASQQAEWDQAQQRVRVEALEHDQVVKEAEDGIRLLRGVQAAQVDKKRAEQQIEIDRIAALSQLGTEALIAGSDSEKAALIAELKKTEMLKDFSEEQILAMAAEKSADVAEAFKEKFRSLGGAEAQQQVNAMYEKMLAEQKAASGDLSDVQREHAKMLQELFQQTLTVQGQVAGAAAQSQRPQVVMPGAGGQPTVIGQPGTVACPGCGARTKADGRFCDKCGAPLQGT